MSLGGRTTKPPLGCYNATQAITSLRALHIQGTSVQCPSLCAIQVARPTANRGASEGQEKKKQIPRLRQPEYGNAGTPKSWWQRGEGHTLQPRHGYTASLYVEATGRSCFLFAKRWGSWSGLGMLDRASHGPLESCPCGDRSSAEHQDVCAAVEGRSTEKAMSAKSKRLIMELVRRTARMGVQADGEDGLDAD